MKKTWLMLWCLACCTGLLGLSGCGSNGATMLPNTWTELKPNGPVPSIRASHAMVYDTDANTAFLFGGFSSSITVTAGAVHMDSPQTYDDTWAYDPADNSWTELKPSGSAPSTRGFHAMVYDSSDKKMILFGGVDASSEDGGPLNDTWAYDPATNAWTELVPAGVVPPGRYDHAMCYDPVGGTVIVFGGRGDAVGTSTDTFDDTWVFDRSTNTWTEVHPTGQVPPARHGHMMAYDPSTQRVVLFGGVSSSMVPSQDVQVFATPQEFNDTWVYDPAANTWTELKPNGTVPSPRTNAALACDPTSGNLVLFGGVQSGGLGAAGTLLDDMWTYDPAAEAWTEVSPEGASPSPRAYQAMVYDSLDRRLVLFGGLRQAAGSEQSSFGADTWVYARGAVSR